MYAAPTEIYTLSLHDALPICGGRTALLGDGAEIQVRGVEQLELVRGLVARGKDVGRSEEHTSELQSLRHLVCRLLLEKKKTTLVQPTDQNVLRPNFARQRRSL